MATTLVEPFTPWLRELGQVMHNQGTVGAFVPPADLLIDDDGVTVYMDVPGLRAENIQIELEAWRKRLNEEHAREASISDGVLKLRMPKPESLRPRRIEVRADGDRAGQEAGTTA
jgi:HSP20 family molecular chaperone IbpA